MQVKVVRYQPQFFTAPEYRVLEQLTALIIPSDATPGAREAGVSEFIDFMVWSDPKLQFRFRTGLTWLEARSRSLFNKTLSELTLEQQTEILRTLAYKEHYRTGDEDGRLFFRLLREYTVMGFYTTRIGLEQIDYPGFKLYSDSPECPHTGDPEHRLLRPRDA